MRLWSVHPKYLDPPGLVALWREALLAQKVLQNKTTGYKQHPQLERFRREPAPLQAIGYYLEKDRNPAAYRKLSGIEFPEAHPIFQIVDGGKESWEK
jgi:hypothetical protein